MCIAFNIKKFFDLEVHVHLTIAFKIKLINACIVFL